MSQVIAQFYVYGVKIPGVVAGGVGNGVIQIESGSAFQLDKLTFGAVNVTGGADFPNPRATVQLTDISSGQNVFNSPLYIASIFGTAQRPYILPLARIFAASTAITFQVTNLESANTVDFYFALHGRKLYGYTPARNA